MNTSASLQGPTTPLPPTLRSVIRNRTLYSLGISLIELWYGKRLSEMHRPEDGLIGTGDVRTDVITENTIANRMVDELADNVGEIYADAVRKCISCTFGQISYTLEDAEFQKAVFQGVVSQPKANFDYLCKSKI